MTASVQQISLDEEYKKNTGIIPEDIAKLRAWLHTQPHLPHKHITDLDLILVFHSCDRSFEVSKQVLDLNYTLRTLFPFLKNRVLDTNIVNALKVTLITSLPTRSKDGYFAIYTRLMDTDAKNFIFFDLLRIAFMETDLCQYEEGTWPGFIMLVDLENFTLSHLAKLELQNLQQFFCFIQEAMFVKMKGIHYLNAPPFMDKIMMIIRPFLKKDLLEKIRIHHVGSMTLDEYYPISGLPKEVGGDYKSLIECQADVTNKIMNNKEFYDNENLKRVIEAKRLGKPKSMSDIFGCIEGSFKKLNID